MAANAVDIVIHERLGHGSYGIVCKAKYFGVPCAAKMIYEYLVEEVVAQDGEELREHRTPFARFQQECDLLSRLKHPNIVQYLGTCRNPNTGLPVLLMELMDDSLTNYLEMLRLTLPYHVQVNICHDIVRALVYLHHGDNQIVHRDLSGKNVLLSGTSTPNAIKAKVADFGMVQLSDQFNWSDCSASLTKCPGTDVYMPPEAVSERPNYTEKIDCFSFGVLVIQILTQEFPCPENRTIKVDKMLLRRVREIDRRQNHICLIPRDHALRSIALTCLKDDPTERPSAHQLSEQLSGVKSDDFYKNRTPQSTPQERSTARDTPKSNDKQQTLGVDMDSACVLTEPSEDDTVVKDKLVSPLKLTWVKGGDTPCRLFQWCDAVVHGNLIYFRQSGIQYLHNNYCYDASTRGWRSLPRCPLGQPTLVLVDGELTVIGDKSPISNQMYTLHKTPHDECWVVSQYPPMPTKRYFTVAVCTKMSLIVAGGKGERREHFLSKVEVLDLAQKVWSTAADLPIPLMRCSATLCGENMYVLGGRTLDFQRSPAVFTCSMHKLLESCQPRQSSGQTDVVWTRIADLPIVDSAAVSVHGWLLAVGGAKENDDKAVSSAVHLYNPSSNSWEVISHMTVARFQCFAALLPNGQLMVVGGGIHPYPNFRCCKDVEFGTVTLS